MAIYAFAFQKWNIGVRVLYRLNNIDHCYPVWPNNFSRYLDMLIHDQPEYVLGLGSYPGRDQDHIRIETVCTNRFGNGFLAGNILQTRQINSFIPLLPGFKLADNLGTFWCNRASWEITGLIQSGKLSARFAFLHLPQKDQAAKLSLLIDRALGDLNKR